MTFSSFLQSTFRFNIRLAEAPSFGESIFQYAASSNGAEDYRLLADEVLNRKVDNKSMENVTDEIAEICQTSEAAVMKS